MIFKLEEDKNIVFNVDFFCFFEDLELVKKDKFYKYMKWGSLFFIGVGVKNIFVGKFGDVFKWFEGGNFFFGFIVWMLFLFKDFDCYDVLIFIMGLVVMGGYSDDDYD